MKLRLNFMKLDLNFMKLRAVKFKVAGLWALWRQWCDLFYNRDQFDQDRLGEWLFDSCLSA